MRKQGSCLEKDNARNNARCTQARKTTHGLCGQDCPWKSQSEWQRTKINGESTSMVWPTLGSRAAKEQNRTVASVFRLSNLWVHEGHAAVTCKNRLVQIWLQVFPLLVHVCFIVLGLFSSVPCKWLAHHTHTHTRLAALFPGLPRWAGTRKVKPIWILLKPETVSGHDISWAIRKSASRSRQITTPAPHHSVFYRPDALPAAQPTASKHWRH